MRYFVTAVLLFSCLLALPLAAQTPKEPVALNPDPYGAKDTVFAEVAMIDDTHASVTLSYFNDEEIVGLAVPLKMSAGLNKLVADSAIFTGGRVEGWSFLKFRPDTAVQCVTVGMIANMGPTNYKMSPGMGRVATVFISSLEGKKIEDLVIDTTTTYPTNYLQSVTDMVIGTPPDTIRPDFDQRQFTPVWVVRYTK